MFAARGRPRALTGGDRIRPARKHPILHAWLPAATQRVAAGSVTQLCARYLSALQWRKRRARVADAHLPGVAYIGRLAAHGAERRGPGAESNLPGGAYIGRSAAHGRKRRARVADANLPAVRNDSRVFFGTAKNSLHVGHCKLPDVVWRHCTDATRRTRIAGLRQEPESHRQP